MSRPFFIIASLLGFLGVATGAFGAHVLRDSLSLSQQEIFETAVRYHLYHTFALIVAAWALEKYEQQYFVKAGWLFVAGVALFSGSLYILVITGQQWLGAVTPVGGLALLAGWLYLGAGFWRLR